MKKLKTLIILFYLTLKLNAQTTPDFEFKIVPYGNLTSGFSGFLNNATFTAIDQQSNRIYYQNIKPNIVDTQSFFIPKICSDTKAIPMKIYSGAELEIITLGCTPSIYSVYLFDSVHNNFVKFVLPDGSPPILYTIDRIRKMNYYCNVDANKIYSYSKTNNLWDSIINPNFSLIPIFIQNKIGILKVIDNNTNEIKLASTNDGFKTYTIFNNLDSTKAPIKTKSSGILTKLTIITNLYWIAQYQFDSAGTTMNKVYFTNDAGATWKILFNFDLQETTNAGNGTVYCYPGHGGNQKGQLFRVSNYGNTICETNFQGTIKQMNFWDENNGYIITLDTPNNQPGIWRVYNGGGSPCVNVGILTKAKTTPKFSLYPNPTSSVLNIKAPFEAIFFVINTLGETIFSGKLNEKENSIDVSSFAAGVYIIRMGDETQKWVKD